MRRLVVLALVSLLACSKDDPVGALFTITNNGPGSAAHADVVLATFAGTTDTQRPDEASLAPAPIAVDYYTQVALGGELSTTELGSDGHRSSVLIQPNANAAVDTSAVIPFLIEYDVDDDVIAVGTFFGSDGSATTPQPIAIVDGELDRYTFTVDSTTPGTLGDDFASDDVALVQCPGSGSATFPSGLVWQPPIGNQIRLLLPDTSADSMATSAVARTQFDLDCDGALALVGSAAVPAPVLDCDDLFADIYAGADEKCDGRNERCGVSGPPKEVACTPDATKYAYACDGVALTGYQVCDQTTSLASACVPDVACACSQPGHSTEPGCRECLVGLISEDGPIAACVPAYTQLPLPGCAGNCTAVILAVSAGWTLGFAGTPLAMTVSNATTAELVVSAAPSTPTASGVFYLAVLGGTNVAQLFGFTLGATTSGGSALCGASAGSNQLECTPYPGLD